MILARLALTGIALTVIQAEVFQERAPGVKRLQFLVEVDIDRAREVGWTDPSAEAVLGLAAQLVQKRFAAMERAAVVELEPGTTSFRVSLPSIDTRDRELFEGMLRSLGLCEFLFAAEGDLEAEREKLKSWRTAHPEEALDEFNMLDPEDQGPADGLAWFATRFSDQSGEPLLVRLPTQAADYIGATSFEHVHLAQDAYGYPAIGFTLHSSRADDFARVTEAHLEQRLGIVIEGKLRSAPTLKAKLIGGGLIEGRFTAEEAARLAETFTKLEGPLDVVEVR